MTQVIKWTRIWNLKIQFISLNVIIIKGYQKYLVLGFTATFDKLPKQVTNFMAQGWKISMNSSQNVQLYEESILLFPIRRKTLSPLALPTSSIFLSKILDWFVKLCFFMFRFIKKFFGSIYGPIFFPQGFWFLAFTT